MNIANKPKTRWGALLYHLVLSGVIFIAITLIIVFIWYPTPYFYMGGWQGLKIVFLVDMVLGPLLTLLVYDIHKKSLTFDLAVIATLQLLALAWGTTQIYGERPVIQVLSEEGLTIFTESETIAYDLDLSIIGSDRTPVTVYLNLPSNPVDIVNLRMQSALSHQKPLEAVAEFYKPIHGITTDQWQWFTNEHKEFSTKLSMSCQGILLPLQSKHLSGTEAGCLTRHGILSID